LEGQEHTVIVIGWFFRVGRLYFHKINISIL